MVARAAALLSLLLAGPAFAAPRLTPDSSNDAIFEAINAADPALTGTPAPVEDLIAAAELAEARLETATTPRALGDLLTLAATARKVAYSRTGSPLHLCALQAATRQVLAREGLPDNLRAEATGLGDDASAGLAAHDGATCPRPAPNTSDVLLLEPPPTPEPQADPLLPMSGRRPSARHPVPADEHPGRSLALAGGVTLALGLGMLGVAGYTGGRVIEARRDAQALAAMVDGYADADQLARDTALRQEYRTMAPPTLVLALAGGASFIVGAVLVGVGGRRMARAASRTALLPAPGGLAFHARF